MHGRQWLVVLAAIAALVVLSGPSHAATAESCRGLPATLVGTDRADALLGTPDRDVIVAGRGNDVIWGRGGHDVICAEDGHDTVYGGRGDDLIDAGRGSDEIYAGAGDDIVRGKRGADLLEGAAGDDRLFGGPGADVTRGQSGVDHCWAEIRSKCESGQTTTQPPPRLQVIPSSIEVEATSPVTAVLRFRTNVCATARHQGIGDVSDPFLNPAVGHQVVHTGGNYPLANPCWVTHRAEFGTWTPPLEPCGRYLLSAEVRDKRGQHAQVPPQTVAVPCRAPTVPALGDIDITYESNYGTVWDVAIAYSGPERARIVIDRIAGRNSGECLMEEIAIGYMWWWDGAIDHERYDLDPCGYRPDTPGASSIEGIGTPKDFVVLKARAITWDGQESDPSYITVDWDYCRDVPDGC